jgi:hypothetical protein
MLEVECLFVYFVASLVSLLMHAAYMICQATASLHMRPQISKPFGEPLEVGTQDFKTRNKKIVLV